MGGKMGARVICKIAIDFIMTVMLLLLMAFQLTGQFAHELIGASMFILMIAHNILNRKWYQGLLKGCYTPFRVFQTAINFLVFLSMIGLMISGAILSRYVFDFLPITGGTAFGRTLHIFSAYWGFVLMSLHLGLHWNMLMGIALKALKSSPSRSLKIMLRAIAAMIAVYGLYAFIKNQILTYMLLQNHFVFFDFEQPAAIFFADYLAMMGFFVFLAYYGTKIMRKNRAKINDREGAL